MEPHPGISLISIVLPAYNEEAHLGATLSHLQRVLKEEAPDISSEIVVCDNNSTDRTAEIAAANGAHVVFEPHNQIARARNTGAKGAKGDWLIFIDADTIPGPGLIAETLRLIRSGTIGGGGAAVRFDTTRLRLIPTFFIGMWNAVSRHLHLAAGSYIFCQRADWETVGGFDERIYAGEELYFSQALKKQVKKRGLRFRVIHKHHVVTSARKLEWHSDWGLLKLLPLAFNPWALKSREACSFWYERPQASKD